jgi:hypothetical protein
MTDTNISRNPTPNLLTYISFSKKAVIKIKYYIYLKSWNSHSMFPAHRPPHDVILLLNPDFHPISKHAMNTMVKWATLLLYIQEVPHSIEDKLTWLAVSVIFLSPFRQMPIQYLNLGHNQPHPHPFLNSLFTNNCIIWCYIVSAIKSVVK